MKTREQKEFVAGFMDGDGCIKLRTQYESSMLAPKVTFAQSYNASEPPELLYIQKLYGGSIYRVKNATESWRNAWELSIMKHEEILELLKDISKHAILKRAQAQLVIDQYDVRHRNNHPAWISELRDMKESYPDVEIERTRLTTSYLAGLFAAEGSVGLYPVRHRWGSTSYYLRVRFGIKSCHRLLHAIKEVLGAGSVQETCHTLTLSQIPGARFLEQLIPHLIGQKVAQSQLVIAYYRARQCEKKRVSVDSQIEAQEVAEKIKKLKRM